MRKRAETASLQFRGAPPILEALAPLQLETTVFGDLALDSDTPAAAAMIAPLSVQAVPAGPAATRVLLSLPPTTPPGTYTGALKLERNRHPVTVEVYAQTSLLITPPYLNLRGVAGAELDVELTLVNAGNVDFELARVHAFNLLQLGAVEDSIHAVLRQEPPAGERRFDRFTDELAARHGGLVRVAIEEGAGTIPPAETRRVRARLQLPGELAAGTSYSSTWRLGNLNVSVDVVVDAAKKIARVRRTA